MVTSTISIRVPVRIKKELDEYTNQEKLSQMSESVRKLLLMGLSRWREERAVELLENGEITFNEAARTARMDVWSFADLLHRSGAVWVRTHPDDVKRDIEDALR